ncbi:hypothetical protein BH18ACT6_BH18ACT6_10150 [soil metagenome]
MKGALLLVALLLLSCGAPQATPNSEGCPIDDEAACGIAVEAANALAAKDAGRLVELSRTDTITCSEVARDYFPGCAKAETLEGHGLSDAELTVEFVDEDAYEARVDSLLETIIEPVEILGIGTCGPDEPGRRTYHVAWTSGSNLGSFELTYVDDWRIALPISTASQIGSRNKATRCGTLFARRADHLGGILPLLIQHRPDHAGPSGGWDGSSVDNVSSKMTLGMTARHHGKLGPGRHVAMDASQDR